MQYKSFIQCNANQQKLSPNTSRKHSWTFSEIVHAIQIVHTMQIINVHFSKLQKQNMMMSQIRLQDGMAYYLNLRRSTLGRGRKPGSFLGHLTPLFSGHSRQVIRHKTILHITTLPRSGNNWQYSLVIQEILFCNAMEPNQQRN